MRLWLLDGKLVELSAWAPCAQRLAGPDVGDAIELLREIRGEMEQRYRDLLASGARKITPGDGLPLHLVACDELAFYLNAEDRKQRTAFAELLRDLVARGRAAGIIVCAATQKPAADVVPSALRDLFGFRLALRCNTPQASDTILGQGWASVGLQRRADRARAARRRAAARRGRPAGPRARLPPRRRGRGRDQRAGRAGCAPRRGSPRRWGAGGVSGSAGTTAMLCRRVREHGDQAAFAELVRRNRVAIRLVVREYRWAIGRGYLERDEATQEVLLAFWEAAGRFEHNWRATFTTFAKVYARTRLKNAVRTQRQRKYQEQRDALPLDAPLSQEDPDITHADQLAAPDYWQPEIIAEIREDLRILSTELPQALSSTEREALTRVMLEEQLSGGTYWNAMTRVRRRAAECLGYEWQPRRAPAPAQRRERALELLADGHGPTEVARRVGVHKCTVIRWRKEQPRDMAA